MKQEKEEFVYLSAYGTIKVGRGNNWVVQAEGNSYVGKGLTKNKYAMYKSGIPFLTKEPKTPIVVDVFKVAVKNLPRVDSLEGHPTFYKRELVPVIVDEQELNTWVYFIVNEERVKSLEFVSTGNY